MCTGQSSYSSPVALRNNASWPFSAVNSCFSLYSIKFCVVLVSVSIMPVWATPDQADKTPAPFSGITAPPSEASNPAGSKWKIVTRAPGTNQPAIRFRDKCNPLWWFGNVDEPIAPDWYRPGKANRNVRYHLRNPCHNFFFYVVGVADKKFRRAGKYPKDNFAPQGAWNVAAANYKYPCLWLPFVSYEHHGFQFYLGWR